MPEPARGGGAEALAVVGEEARARDHVELRVRLEVLEHEREAARVVLAVAVDLHRDVVAALGGVHVARLHGAADAEVVGVTEHLGAGRAGAVGGVVGGAVVDDDDVEVRCVLPQLRDDPGDRGGLVVRRDDGEMTGHDKGETALHCASFGGSGYRGLATARRYAQPAGDPLRATSRRRRALIGPVRAFAAVAAPLARALARDRARRRRRVCSRPRPPRARSPRSSRGGRGRTRSSRARSSPSSSAASTSARPRSCPPTRG